MEKTILEQLVNNNEILVQTNQATTNLLKEQKQEKAVIIQHIKSEYDRLGNKEDKRNKTEEDIYQYLARLLLDFWNYY